MTLRTKLAAAGIFVLLTAGAAYAQTEMSCCDDCTCCDQMRDDTTTEDAPADQ